MKSNLSLPEDTVAEAHYGGVARPSTLDVDVSSEEVVALQRYSVLGGSFRQLIESLQQMSQQVRLGVLGFLESMQQMNEQVRPGLLGFAHSINRLDQELQSGFAGSEGKSNRTFRNRIPLSGGPGPIRWLNLWSGHILED